MRIRLARKILKHPERYSFGKLANSFNRLGWQAHVWRVKVRKQP